MSNKRLPLNNDEWNSLRHWASQPMRTPAELAWISSLVTGQPLDIPTAREPCRDKFSWFCCRFCYVLSGAADAEWVPFHLWPSQREVAGTFQNSRLVVILKARQLGMTWLTVAYALWSM